MARCEGQSTRPIYRVHRWFARRLSTQFRAILAALTLGPEEDGRFWERYEGEIDLSGTVLLDPFVGGGTSVVEGSRCGARVVGYDVDPIAAAIARFELGVRGRREGIASAMDHVVQVRREMARYHLTRYEDQDVQVLHHFWVEETTCPACGRTFELHPHYQLARDRKAGVQWAFCKHIHEVQCLPLSQLRLESSEGRRTTIRAGTLSRGKAICPYRGCGHVRRLGEGDAEAPPRWVLFAQEVLVLDGSVRGGYRREFRRATDEDRALAERASVARSEAEREGGRVRPTREIPETPRFDRRPLIHGVRSYDQLFNGRQLLHLTLLGQTIRQVGDDSVREALALAFTEHLTTCCMYTSYAFDYRRTSPLFSIHGYRHVVRPVELNPWLDGIGRGTFPNAVRKLQRAAAYAAAPTDVPSASPIGPDGGVVAADACEVFEGRADAAVVVGSSEELRDVPDDSVDLVLTDPPYLDNVSYSELSDFYLAWRQGLREAAAPYDDGRSAPLNETLATTERTEAAAEAYMLDLATVFSECRRVIRAEGVMVFTYHHKEPLAWAAVGEALVRAGFAVTSVQPMRGEGDGGLHTKTGTIKWDAVVVCRPSSAVDWERALRLPPGVGEGAVQEVREQAEALRGAAFRPPDAQNLLAALLATRLEESPCDTEPPVAAQIVDAVTSALPSLDR